MVNKALFGSSGEYREPASVPSTPWRFRWPNTADFNFNYYHLLEINKNQSIGCNNNPQIKVAIIGAGIAGLTAARELFRCGYTNIDIYEASHRIGGRTYSIAVEGQHTVLEMGAMRMPFFPAPGSRNSVLDYYRELFQITTQPFPDPGSSIADTGIYLNNGCGPDTQNPYPKPRLDIWQKNGGPPNPLFKAVYDKWVHFADMVTSVCQEFYGQDGWEEFWHNVVQYYWDKNFRELVYMAAIDRYDPSKPGYFGGLGMNEAESKLFYTIGAGDGGWGAFYDISCLYPMRTLLFGFGTNHQLIQGTFDGQGNFAPGSQYQQRTTDSLEREFPSPGYVGVQTFAECLFYQPVTSEFVENVSLYEASKTKGKYDVNLYLKNPVNRIKYLDRRNVEITSANLESPRNYDLVILTPTTWATEMGMAFEGFDPKTQLPFDVTYSIKESHWISSCKVFYPLKERYWEISGCPIPQLISTDTYLQGVYGYAVKNDPGVLLVSYTWEDDANKFIAESDRSEQLAKQCLDELDKILIECENIKTPVSPYVDTSRPAVIHWAKMPNYRGCAKLYREMTWNDDYALLRYNQKYSANSGLYFAGEAFSVEGGWTEPALRTALDAVIHAIANTDGTFLNGFEYSDYPKYDDWNPFDRKPKG
ncbi:MAG: NAD(P)/FAD-dependent oxidoreductase [Microcoleus sp.]|uniref:flavin monoamine oxidase family protein n=1 Tax=Microcoleus sp. TaxID=44472 RepID=UPI003C793553